MATVRTNARGAVAACGPFDAGLRTQQVARMSEAKSGISRLKTRPATAGVRHSLAVSRSGVASVQRPMGYAWRAEPGYRHSASSRAFTPVFDGLWTRVNALMAHPGYANCHRSPGSTTMVR
jgi:hypothetical protein